MTVSFCPHCSSSLQDHPSRAAARCADCRLVIGPGRALAEPSGEARSGGFMANAARREEVAPVDAAAAKEALRGVASRLGVDVRRLRMTDYDAAVRGGQPGPSVAAVLSTFDSWKAARASAHRGPSVDAVRATARRRAA